MVAVPRLVAVLLPLFLGECTAHGDSLPHPHQPDGGGLATLSAPGHSLPHPDEDRCTARVRQLFPLGGPFSGNTAVTITGVAFQDVGDVKCRFGLDEVQARVVNETIIECSSPGCTSPTCLTGQEQTEVSVALEISLNGVTFTGSGLQFTY